MLKPAPLSLAQWPEMGLDDSMSELAIRGRHAILSPYINNLILIIVSQ